MQSVVGKRDAKHTLIVEETANGKEKEQLKASLQDEVNNMAKNRVLKVVHMPRGFTPI